MAAGRAGAVALLLCLAAVAGAQESAADSTAAGPGATRPLTSADSTAAGGADPAPRAALWRSALLPGWGQLAGGHRVKAALFAGAAAGFLGAAASAQRGVDDPPPAAVIARGQGAVSAWQEDRAARRSTRVLCYVVVATLAGIDAYVDARLDDFDVDAGFSDEGAGAWLRYRF